jgi:hypothetical protein
VDLATKNRRSRMRAAERAADQCCRERAYRVEASYYLADLPQVPGFFANLEQAIALKLGERAKGTDITFLYTAESPSGPYVQFAATVTGIDADAAYAAFEANDPDIEVQHIEEVSW